LAEARLKGDLLRKELEYLHRVPVPKESVVVALVFTNPAVKLDPRSVAALENVFTLEQFETFCKTEVANSVKHGPSWSEWLWSWVPFTKQDVAKKLDSSARAQATEILLRTRTWDMITLHNGTTITGDVRHIDIPSAGVSHARNHVTRMDITWAANTYWGLLTSVVKGGAAEVHIQLVEHKRLPKRNENKPRDGDGNLRFMLEQKGRADQIVLRPAGSAQDETVPLRSIRQIALSSHVAR